MTSVPATAFFFGAGVSTADDVPGTADLTAAVRHRVGDEGLGPLWDALAFEARGLDLGQNRGFINYEDVCYLADQVRDALTGEYDNAGMGALVHTLSVRLEGRMSALPGRENGPWSPSVALEGLRIACGELVSCAVDEVAKSLWFAVTNKKPPLRAYQALI